MSNTQDYTRALLGLAAAQICQSLGWHSVHRSSHGILTDVLERYLKQLSKAAASYSQNDCRTVPNLDDLELAFEHLGIHLHELEDYVHQVEPSPLGQIPPLNGESICGKKRLLTFSKDGHFPPIVEPIPVNEVTADVKDEIMEVDTNLTVNGTGIDKVNRPKELVLHTDSVESPPYSPLEPKSLNADAQGNMDLTRPDLKVTTPKGYTPTLTTQAPVIGIASLTNVVSSNQSPASVVTLTPPNSMKYQKDAKVEVKKKDDNQETKSTIKETKMPTIVSPPKLSSIKLKSPSSKHHKQNDIKSPKSCSTAKTVQSPKPRLPVTDKKKKTTKTSEKAPFQHTEKSPVLHKKSGKTSEKSPVPYKKTQTIMKSETVSLKEKVIIPQQEKDETNVEIQRKIRDSPPPLTFSPQILISPPVIKKEEPDASQPLIIPSSKVKSKDGSPVTPSRTVIFPPRDTLLSPVQQDISSEKLSGVVPKLHLSEIKNEPVSESEEKPVPKVVAAVHTKMPVLTLQKNTELCDKETTGKGGRKHEVDILSISHDETNVTDNKHLFKSNVLHPFGTTDEKKKKKKKKSEKERDEKGRKSEGGKEKKVKKKKRAEKQREKESFIGIPKLTLKMGGETIKESDTKIVLKSSAPLPRSESSLSPPELLPPSASSNGNNSSSKKLEGKQKSTGFYAETLTNTSSSLGGEVYYCPGCGLPDDGSPMIGCDACDLWYHWPCVKITIAPADEEKWFCPKCLHGAPPAKKKKKKKKRDS